MKGFGTKDDTLIRILAIRSDVDIPAIKNAYRQKFGKNLRDDIRGDLTGDYEDLFVALVDKYN